MNMNFLLPSIFSRQDLLSQMPARPLPPCPRKHIRISSSVFFSSLCDERFGAKTSHTSDFYCPREKALVQLGTVNSFILFRSLPSFCRAPLLHFPARTSCPRCTRGPLPQFFPPGPLAPDARAAPSPNFPARTFPPDPRAVPSPICLTVSL